MSSQQTKARKPSMCNRCYTNVNWNNDKRKAMGTTRPLTLDGTAVHECPKDGADNIIINQENQRIWSEWEASQSSGGQQTLASSSSSSGGGMTNSDVTIIMGTILQKMNDLTTQQAKYNEAIDRMEKIINTQKEIIDRYLQHDPVGSALNQVIQTMMKYLPEPELKPQTADKLPRATTTYNDDADLEI